MLTGARDRIDQVVRKSLAGDEKSYACWWPLYRAKNARIRYNNRHYYLARFVYETYRGPIPEGGKIVTICREKCVNPRHLICVTHKEWMNEIQHRLSQGINHSVHNPRSRRGYKLDEAKADSIREQYYSGTSPRTLASAYGVCRATIYLVVKYRTWAWHKPLSQATHLLEGDTTWKG